MRSSRKGQSLVEILIALAVGVILIIGALTIITPTLKTGSDVTRAQTAAALGKQLFDNLRALGEEDWHSLDSLSTTSVNKYYVIASTSPFTATSGQESISVGTTTYTRWFYLDDVYRNSSGKIDLSGSALDPSTKRATIVYTWPQNASNTYVAYLTRSHDKTFLQSDWSGGPNQEGPLVATSVNSKYSTSSNIDYSTSSGVIVIQGF